ncbi:MAG TPA: vitamin B12 dependent-methionine synthase activation domain-containing protein [Syntrophobacteria bacterium]|nr:vitamin B12 dependent-methionine synthase activation domain-containing protein [Syntrophobacteria bacterium]
MTEKIVDQVPLRFDVASILARAGLEVKPAHLTLAEDLARDAAALGRPRALYRASYLRKETERTVVVDGVTLTSRVLRVNLEPVDRAFPFVATCGWELDRWVMEKDEPLQRRVADVISEFALYSALGALKARLREEYRLATISRMSPGSLEDWPLYEQKLLFQLFDDAERAVGVRLTDDLMMLPRKSLSGILFATEDLFESCLLCPREECPARLMPYDRDLFTRRYL